MAEIFYSGEQPGRVTVRQGETKRPLDPRFELHKHSPDGFAWDKGDAEPAQLALALLARRTPKRRPRTPAAPSFQASRYYHSSQTVDDHAQSSSLLRQHD